MPYEGSVTCFRGRNSFPGISAGVGASTRQLRSLHNAQGNLRLMVDAEHSYMQPAIDALAIRAQQRCNRAEAVVINTYQ